MITNSDREESHKLYMELGQLCPQYFKSGSGVEYITDLDWIKKYEDETGERIGVLYKMNDYEVFVVDLVRKDGKLKLHGRVILPYNGVIIVPKLGEKFIFEAQYRYPTCCMHIAFPRGHCEKGATPEDDAIRETKEELGAELKNLHYLGKTYPETNSNAWYCSVISGDVSGLALDDSGTAKRDGYEGISGLVAYTAEEIEDLIKTGQIDCGYTLAAWSLYKASLA